MKRALALGLLLTLLAAASVAGQPLPALPTSDAAPSDPSWWQSIAAYVQQIQNEVYHRHLPAAIHAIRDQGSLSALAWLLGLSFVYGVVHAAGPGHGKAVITAYLVAEETAVRRGIVLSFLSAAAQGMTAILAVGILAAVFGLLSKEVVEIATILEMASYAMIAALGAYLLYKTAREIITGRIHDHAPRHDHHHHSHDDHAYDHGHAHTHAHHDIYPTPDDARTWRQGFAVVATIGLRPCSGAILVLLFTLAQGVFFSGILATAAMSLGTAITVATLAVFASSARRLALSAARTMDGWMLWTYWGLSIAGGLFLLLSGLVLFTFPPIAPLPGAS